MDVIDLTRPMTGETLVALGGRRSTEGWHGGGVRVEYQRDWSLGHNTSQCEWFLDDHLGTHVDAPSHVIAGGATVDQLDLRRLIGPAVVMDCTFATGRGITAADLERAQPQPEPTDIVLLYAAEPPGTRAEYLTHQTYVTVDAARWLVEREVSAVGVEMACFEDAYQRVIVEHRYDPPETNPWPAHRVCLERDVYILEGLTNLHLIAGERVDFAAAPLPVPGSSGSPVRAFAWHP
jgi:kynurenine formamidase